MNKEKIQLIETILETLTHIKETLKEWNKLGAKYE